MGGLRLKPSRPKSKVTKLSTSAPSAFHAAFREHRGALYRYLRRRLGNDEDARELAQEAFLRLLRTVRADLVADPQAYLYRIARNLVYEQSSKNLPAESWVDNGELDTLEDPHGTLETEAVDGALGGWLEQALAELAPRNRAIVLLFCQGGLSQREIGERLGLSKSMVQKSLAQGFAQCRKRMRLHNRAGVSR